MVLDQSDTNVVRASQLDCALISDALDRLGIAGQCQKIKPCDPSFRLTGRAFTVLYEPTTIETGNVGDFIDDVPPGRVVVIDNRGRDDVGTWGNILTEFSHRKGIAGTVIDGNNRDVSLCRELGYPIFSYYTWMRTGKGRIQLKGLEVPVIIGGVVVNPGDIVRGDADGVVVIPKVREAEVLDVAEHIANEEQQLRDAIRSGMRMDEARKKFRYHDLQSPSYDKAN